MCDHNVLGDEQRTLSDLVSEAIQLGSRSGEAEIEIDASEVSVIFWRKSDRVSISRALADVQVEHDGTSEGIESALRRALQYARKWQKEAER